MIYEKEKVMQWLGKWGAEDGYDIEKNDEEFVRWIGRKVEWGRVDGSRLSQVFVRLAKHIEDR